MKIKVLNLLKESKSDFISGEKISNELGVSRAAIWKYIKLLKEDGYEIESVSRKGYRIVNSPDLLTFEEIKEHLNTNSIGKKIFYFDSINSTNIKAKELADLGEPHGTVIISEEQTLGRGRLGRSWVSPKYKGIWFSIILKPDTTPEHISKITQVGAASVYKSINHYNINPLIKWPNDIIVNKKKICGILTEMSSELNKINYVILGIGINVNMEKKDFTKEIENIATSLKIETNKEISRKKLICYILNNFEYLYEDFLRDKCAKKSMDICKMNSILIGKNIDIIKSNETVSTVRVLDLNENGELVVKHENGKIENLFSGEVSLKSIYRKN